MQRNTTVYSGVSLHIMQRTSTTCHTQWEFVAYSQTSLQSTCSVVPLHTRSETPLRACMQCSSLQWCFTAGHMQWNIVVYSETSLHNTFSETPLHAVVFRCMWWFTACCMTSLFTVKLRCILHPMKHHCKHAVKFHCVYVVYAVW